MATAAPPPQRSRLRRWTVTSLKIFLYGLLVSLIALCVAVAVAVSQLPSYGELVRRDNLGQMVRVRAANGDVIQSMGPVFGEWVPYERIPPVMRDAMISVEDRRFRSHLGVDPIGIIRGIWLGITGGERVRGVSTITQQLARNIFLSRERSFARKLREAILAMALEWRFSKDQILELYLNRVYFGGGAYGIDAASRRFFGHSATQMSTAEAAIIAGLVKAPSNYSPTADAEAAQSRAGVALELMVQNGAITPAQAAEAHPENVRFVRTEERQSATRYFTDWVLPQLDTLIDESVQPLDVWTTIDPNMQRVAMNAINANAPAGAQGALVTLDRDGAVRAMVGGRDYVNSSYNRATQAIRQPGSSFKLFVYLTAIESGYRPDTMVDASPITVGGWTPRNDSGRTFGQVPLRVAFAYSINTAAVHLAQEVGTRSVADMAQRFGVTTHVETNPSMALGSSAVRLIDMTRAYAAVARGGVGVTPYGIRRVTTADGTLLYQHQDDQSRVLVAPWVAAQMTQLLQDVVLHGTARAADLGRPTAGKTGTTSSNKDGWFVGFSSGLTTGVWYGRDDNRALPGLSGGRAPARAFHDLMVRAVANRPVEAFRTEVAAPDWQNEGGDNEIWYAPPNDQPLVDADGNPLEPETPPADDQSDGPDAAPLPKEAEPDRLDQEWLDRAIDRPRPPNRPPPPRRREAERGDTFAL
jgi:penicillin-binding protein 1A